MRSLQISVGIDAKNQPILVDMEKTGSMIIYGTNATGRTTFCKNIIWSLHELDSNSVEFIVCGEESEYSDLKKKVCSGHLRIIPELHDLIPVLESEVLERYKRQDEYMKSNPGRHNNHWDSDAGKNLFILIDPIKMMDPEMTGRLNEVSTVIGHTGPSIGLHLIVVTHSCELISNQMRRSSLVRVMFRMVRPTEGVVFDYHESAQKVELEQFQFLIAQKTAQPVLGKLEPKVLPW